MGTFVESIVYVLLNDARLTDRLVAKKDDFYFDFTSYGADRMIHMK